MQELQRSLRNHSMTKNFSLLFGCLWRPWINNAVASPVAIDASAHIHRFGGSHFRLEMFANSVKTKRTHENKTNQIKHHPDLHLRGRRALCGRLRRDGISEHNIAALSSRLPRAYSTNAEATANVCRPAAL